MSFANYLNFTETKYYEQTPIVTPQFNKWTLSWWVKTSSITSTPRFGMYGATDDDKTVALFQIYEGNFFYSGNVGDYSYEGFFELYENDDASFLNKWNHHVLVFDGAAARLRWYYNDEEIKMKNSGNFTFPIATSYSGPSNSIRIWFGIFEPSSGDSIANVELFDNAASVGNYGTAGFKLTFNPADVNREFDGQGDPLDIDDPYGSSVQVPHGWLADVSGTGNHWLIPDL